MTNSGLLHPSDPTNHSFETLKTNKIHKTWILCTYRNSICEIIARLPPWTATSFTFCALLLIPTTTNERTKKLVQQPHFSNYFVKYPNTHTFPSVIAWVSIFTKKKSYQHFNTIETRNLTNLRLMLRGDLLWNKKNINKLTSSTK